MISQRNIGLDVLRILLALMVITIHLIWGNNALDVSAEPRNIGLFLSALLAFCYPAVNSYVLISGFFSFAGRKTMRQILKRLLRLWLCLVFAQLLGYAMVLITRCEPFCVLNCIKHLFPLTRGIWWYMSVYFVLILISPALNMVLDHLSKREFLITIAIALLICSVIPFFTGYESPLGLAHGSGGLLWFIVLYLTGGGLYKFYLSDYQFSHTGFSTYTATGYLLLTLYLIFSDKIHNTLGLDGYTSYSYNSIVVYGQAVLLFLFFWRLDIKNNRLSQIISCFAGLSLAAYIYHCQEDIIRHFWIYLIPSHYTDDKHYILAFLAIVLGVYLISISIEYLRRRVFSLGNIETKIVHRILR